MPVKEKVRRKRSERGNWLVVTYLDEEQGVGMVPKVRKYRAWWVVVDSDGAGRVGRCTRCGRELYLNLPMGLKAVAMYMRAFVEEHRACK
jgi:hypothetical protein